MTVPTPPPVALKTAGKIRLDYETYSEAGLYFDYETNKWEKTTHGSSKAGLFSVGASIYAQHPSTEVLIACYEIDGVYHYWVPGTGLPENIFECLKKGYRIEAHNAVFEYYITKYVCTQKYGWPEIPYSQFDCTMERALALSYPASLKAVAERTGGDLKDEEGTALIRKFSIPRNPTRNDPLTRHLMWDYMYEGNKFFKYCRRDVAAQKSVSEKLPQLYKTENDLSVLSQEINERGIGIDVEALEMFIELYDPVVAQANEKIYQISNGELYSISQATEIPNYIYRETEYAIENLREETLDLALNDDELPQIARDILTLRKAAGGSAVKKLYAIKDRLDKNGCVTDVFQFNGAARTGRWAGRAIQPHNFPSSGPTDDWNAEQMDTEINTLKWRFYKEGWSPDELVKDMESRYNKPAAAVISGCLRGLLVAKPKKKFICSDFSAIEAVVLACLANETWRIEVFNSHRMIYEASASMITGVPFEDFVKHKKEKGEHHPLRKKIGKFAELASGYQGGLGAWKKFGAGAHLSDQEIKDAVKLWREKSPRIVQFWYAMERMLKRAIQNPGQISTHEQLSFISDGKAAAVILPSGRKIYYQDAKVVQVEKFGSLKPTILYHGKTIGGAGEWDMVDTYGGKITENIVQAVARDILAYSMLELKKAGYEIAMHIHDEVVVEIDEDKATPETLADIERIMTQPPPWAQGWPILATGGWIGYRYCKG